ncbi:MAG TPA: ABC transporter ATP-binding protein [Rubrivivax sp.]|nr:ABC transporter ATP-binding protein [Rubrivivax sp.]
MTALRATDLQVALGGTTVLHGVSLELPPGWTAIVGPNGAGKSTLLRTLAGLLPCRRGEVRLQGRPLDAWSARERALRIAWLAQQGQALGDLTVRELVELGRVPQLGLFGTPGPEDRRAVEQAMQDTECAAWAGRSLQQLSGGERQRCLLARALAVGAPVLLLDEPTTHLDPPHQVAVVRLMQQRARQGTVASVLHDLPLALQADRVVVMRAGRIVASGAHDDPALHAALVEVFDHAVRIERAGARHIALPRL